MKIGNFKLIIYSLLILSCPYIYSKDLDDNGKLDSNNNGFSFNGELTLNSLYINNNDYNTWFNLRYIPQVNYILDLSNGKKLDLELSVNLYEELGLKNKKHISNNKIDPYRLWVRYSDSNSELRLGLQKINFGSAQILRPLMWFDNMDPRDTQKTTKGVWGLLYRYYFNNNANIWFWGLIGNKKNKGLELFPNINRHSPEFGGRVQIPFKHGEYAFTYHHRNKVNVIDSLLNNYSSLFFSDELKDNLRKNYSHLYENRFGFDIRVDKVVGLWAEVSLSQLNKKIGEFTNTQMLTIGGDYTFGIGNGLTLTLEHSINSNSNKLFSFKNKEQNTALALKYPINLFNNVTFMSIYNWKNHYSTNFLQLETTFDNFSINLGVFKTSKKNQVNNLYNKDNNSNNNYLNQGSGVQLKLIWNH